MDKIYLINLKEVEEEEFFNALKKACIKESRGSLSIAETYYSSRLEDLIKNGSAEANSVFFDVE